MDESAEPRDGRSTQGPPVALTISLRIAAVMSLSGGVVAAVLALLAGHRNGPMSLEYVLAAVGLLLLGVLGSGVLWLGGSLVRHGGRTHMLEAGADRARLARLEASVRHCQVENEHHQHREPIFAAPNVAASKPVEQAGSCDNSQILQEILTQLKELNENILMDDQQRKAKAHIRRQQFRDSLINDIQLALDGADFTRAARGIDTLADKIPGDEQIEPLRKRLRSARQAACDEEVEAVTRRACDLMATGAFDQAETEVLAIARRYPDKSALASLLDRIRREGRLLKEERRDRMYGEVASLADARQWRQALGAAKRYIQAFPDGAGTDAVRTMLTTIEDNARIEEVRELRDRIRDLIERRRYAEAVEYARDVIKRFPDTRAAKELGRQMNRLRELARLSSSNGS